MLIFSLPAVSSEEEIDVLYPFIEATSSTLIEAPLFDETFLNFLQENAVNTVLGKEGIPMFYYSENESFGCTGICETIDMNGYTMGSETFSGSASEWTNTISESMIVGDSDIEYSIDTLNGIRQSLTDNSQALSEFENIMMENQDGYLKKVYNDEISDDLWDLSLDKLKADGAYDDIARNMRKGELENGIGLLEEYMQKNFDIEDAYDMSNIYNSLENNRLGTMQSEEFLKNVLERMGEEEGFGINPEDIEKFSDILNSEVFKNVADKTSEFIKNNPEVFDKIQDLGKEMLERPETKEIFKDAIEKLMEEGNWDAIKDIMEIFNELENKDELMEMLRDGFSEHMMEMIESGMIDEIAEMLDDPALREMLMESAKSLSEGMLDSVKDWLNEFPVEIPYIIAAIALVVMFLIILKIKL